MLPSGRLFYKKTDSIPKLLYSKVKVDVKSFKRKEIVIPPRIERKPTDILKALASTISVDSTAFHYKYPDDPYIYPETRVEKRVLALALESGRKSAKWVINENPGFFKQQLADPPIKVFLTKTKEATGEVLVEQDLLNAIEERNVLDAIEAYSALKENQQDVSKSTKQSLLELVCFYNGKAKSDLDVETKWYTEIFSKNTQDRRDVVVMEEWDPQNFIKSLFDEMDSNCPLAFSAVIQGMLKYGDIESAVKLYEEAKVKNIKLSVGVYNAFIEQTEQITMARNESLNYVKEKVYEMAEAGIKPNLETLNAVLMVLQDMRLCKWALGFLIELQNLGIGPSLGTYGYVFKILTRMKPIDDEISLPKVLSEEIMGLIENEKHEILHPADFEFFHSAMNCFANVYADANLAVRLAEMYLRFDNSKFVVRAETEGFFFKQLFDVCLREKPIQDTMKIYRRFVSTIYNPTRPLILDLLKEIHAHFAPECLPEMWESLRRLGYFRDTRFLGRLLQMATDFTDETSLKIFHEAALTYVNNLKESTDTKILEEGLLVALIKIDDEETITNVMELKKKNHLEFLDVTAGFAETFVDYGLSKKNTSLIVEGLKVSSEYEFPFIGEKVEKALPLLSEYDADWARGLLHEFEKGQKKRKKEENEKRKQEVDEEEEE